MCGLNDQQNVIVSHNNYATLLWQKLGRYGEAEERYGLLDGGLTGRR